MKAAWALSLVFVARGALASEERLVFSRFGAVTLYREAPSPREVVLFVSGDGGWNLGVVDMARSLAGLDALVVGIDMTHYLKEIEASREACSYPAADFEALSQFVQKKLGFASYVRPVLVGYSSGATLVYATLVQAPAGTFKGALSMGFCPDLPLTKPFCKGSGLEAEPGPRGKGLAFLPARLTAPWVAFQGAIDKVCDAKAVEAYVRTAGPPAEIVLLPKVGHGFSVRANWMPQLNEAYRRIATTPTSPRASAREVKDLPLIEVPGAEGTGSGDALAVLLTGDGGWAGLDRELARDLSSRGVPVVGFDSLQYFWNRRTPEETARDLERVLRHYLAAWKKKEAILVGYSLGADVLPFAASRLPLDLLANVRLIALLGPGREAEFEFHVTDWLGMTSPGRALPVLPELEKLLGTKLLCFRGKDEEDSLCDALVPGRAAVVNLAGGHHFGGDYSAIANAIVKEMH